MGKHEPMSAKAIANKIKAKGLQKIKYYCEMCKKQCRDDNGFKCHIMSEAHQRQALIVSENPEKFVSEFSKQFMDGFMYILKARYRTKRVLANTVFQEYIKERDHVHMNGTRWTSLTEFANWLGENELAEVEDSERGVMVKYIDRDPETLRRQELDAKRVELAKEAAIRNQKEIEQQREMVRRLYEEKQKEQSQPTPVPIIRIPVVSEEKPEIETESPGDTEIIDKSNIDDQTAPAESGPTSSTSSHAVPGHQNVVERPLFQVQAISLKSTSHSNYRPPPPKRKVFLKTNHKSKRPKTSQ